MDQSKECQKPNVESDKPTSSTAKELITLVGLTLGCVLAAWLVIEVWDYLI